MATSIRHKRNTVAGSKPAAGSLVAGELAINTADGKLFAKLNDNSVVAVGGFQSVDDVASSSINFTPTSQVDVTGVTPGGNSLNAMFSVGAALPASTVRRTTIFGTQNFKDPKDIDRVEVFGNLAAQWMQKAERTTALGTIAAQFFGAYEANVKAYHNFWSTEYTAVAPGVAGWDVGGLETLYPGIGAELAAFTDYASPASDRSLTGRSTFLGRNAGNLTVNGRDLLLAGYRAGSCLFSADATVALGSDAFKNAVFHNEGVAIGYEAGRDWVKGARNVAIGRGAGYQSARGERNVVLGAYAGADQKSLGRNILLGFRAGNGLFSSGSDTLEDAFVVTNDALVSRRPILAGNMLSGALAVNPGSWADIAGLFRVYDKDTGARMFDVDATGLKVNRESYSGSHAKTGWQIAAAGDASSFRAGTGAQAHLSFHNNAAVTPAKVGDLATSGSQLQIRDSSGNARIGITTTGIGFFGVTPVNRQTLNAAATDAATTMALANQIRSFLINTGMMQ